MTKSESPFRTLSDADLLDLLYTAGDRLPREAIDEILSRRGRLLGPLRQIVADKTSWTRPLPEWWASVHATYALGALGDPSAADSLLTALRWADAFDCDWVTEDLPSMFGQVGGEVSAPLLRVCTDITAGPGARSIALAGLAAVALAAPQHLDEVVALAAGFVSDTDEEVYLRQTAANVLLDFRRTEHRRLLLRFGREEAERRREDAEYQGVFYDWEVDELLEGSSGEAGTEYYRRDWLTFYDPEEIERRQERWSREQEETEREQQGHVEPPARDLDAPCTCGSGRPFSRCCYLRIH